MKTYKKWIVVGVASLFCILVTAVFFLPHMGASQFYYSLDDALRYPHSVTRLALRNCGLTAVPVGIKTMTNLECLLLSGNKLHELPDWLRQNSQITWLSLVDNNFSTFPAVLTDMPNLQELNLSRNSLSELPASISRLNSLVELFIANNALTDLPDEIRELKHLKFIDLRGNRFATETKLRIRKLLPNTDIRFDK